MIALNQPAGASTQIPMQYVPEQERLTGQCPQCGWTPPTQNQFRPNNFFEYADEKGMIVVLSETAKVVEIKDGDGNVIKTYKRIRNDRGEIILDRTTFTFLSKEEADSQVNREISAPLPTSHKEVPVARLKQPEQAPAPPTFVHPAPSVIMATKEPPKKTADEIKATPKASLTPAPVEIPATTLNQGLPEGATGQVTK